MSEENQLFSDLDDNYAAPKKDKPKVVVAEVEEKVKPTKSIKRPEGIYKLKDDLLFSLGELLEKEKNKEKLLPRINTLCLKTIDKVAMEFGSKYL